MTVRSGTRSVTFCALILLGAFIAAGPAITAGQPASAVAPHPDGEAALRRYIVAVKAGNPDYAGMTADFGATVSQRASQLQTTFNSWGEVLNVTFTGHGEHGLDEYAVRFDRAILLFSVVVTAEGKIAGAQFGPRAGVYPSRAQADGTPAVAHPGTEAALRRFIAEVQEGSPDYAQMSPALAAAVSEQLPHTQSMFISWGQFRSVKFAGNSPLGWDGYDVVFDHAIASFSIILAADGKVEGHWILSSRATTPAAQP